MKEPEKLTYDELMEKYKSLKDVNKFLGIQILQLQNKNKDLTYHLQNIAKKGKACTDKMMELDKENRHLIIENENLKIRINNIKKEQ